VRLGIVSDIHGNLEALDRAIERMGPVDELLCAGDAFYQFRFSNEVVARLKGIGARYVLGNHEDILLSAAGQRAQEAAEVNRELLEWARAQPHQIRTTIHGKRLLMFHATPWSPNRDYLYASSPEFQRLAREDADVIIYGHTHHQTVSRLGSALVINPGSVGEPRDPNNDFQVSYAVFDTETDLVRIDDFPDPTRNIAKHSGEQA
jgi:putative phosphoesterase